MYDLTLRTPTRRPNVRMDDVERWMRKTSNRERWFVSPSHHVPKAADATSVGILTHFAYSFSVVALGHLSLYHRLNRDPACRAIADRIFAYEPLTGPDGQLAADLEIDRPLTTFERQIVLDDLSLICVSLTNPDAVTTVLNLLRLGGVPLRREEREDGTHPIILGGGPGCANPEPFADYFDLFCVGDGRTLTAQIVGAIHECKSSGTRVGAREIHDALGNADGLYVPALYEFSYVGARIEAISHPPEAPECVIPASDAPDLASQVSLLSDGDCAVIAPNTGCEHHCGYCQISELPYLEFDIGPLLERVEVFLASGISKLIINSATLTQHSEVQRLLLGIADRVERCGRRVNVYIGSMRFDEVSAELLWHIGRLEAFSHTFLLYTNGAPVKYLALAPEHGSRGLMRRVGRAVDPWRILETVEIAAQQGIHNFVLYFIVGFESETDDDRDQISALAAAVLDQVSEMGGGIVMKINPLIPTPGTACQRMAMPSIATYQHYLDQVREGIVKRVGQDRFERQVEVVPLPAERLMVEAVINRADRRIGPLIGRLAEARARGLEPSGVELQDWVEEFGLSSEHLVDERSADEILPWQAVERASARIEQRVLTLTRRRD